LEDKSNKFKCGYFEKSVANLNKLLEARTGSEKPYIIPSVYSVIPQFFQGIPGE
jgi:hypothetical protein